MAGHSLDSGVPGQRPEDNAGTKASFVKRPNGVGNSNVVSALNTDVHRQIMSFLPTSDLSFLLRTCRYFLTVGIPALCQHAGKRPIEKVRHALSLRAFLRVGAAESRDVHIMSLWFRLPEVWHFVARENTSQRPEHWNAVLTILHNCRELRMLRIDTWDQSIDPIVVLNAILTSQKSLEVLSMALTPDLAEELHGLSRMGLRRLSFQWPQNPHSSLAVRRAVVSTIRPLATTLVEVNNIIPRYVPAPFQRVQKLGLTMDRSETFIRDAVRTFPNVFHLTLHSEHHQRCHWDVSGPAEDAAFRDQNKSSWSLNYRRAWPSLTAMWAEDLCGAYCLGIVRSVQAISLPLTLDSRFHMLSAIVTDMQPSFLELRVDLDDPRICTGILDRLRMPDWRWLAHPANASLSHMTLLLEGLDRAPVYASYQTEAKLILEGFASALHNAFLTHLLLRYPGRQDIEPIVDDALQCATRLANASPGLCWIGVETCAAGLLCWDIARTQVPGSAGQDTETMLSRVSEDVGVRILEQEGMDVFQYVQF